MKEDTRYTDNAGLTKSFVFGIISFLRRELVTLSQLNKQGRKIGNKSLIYYKITKISIIARMKIK